MKKIVSLSGGKDSTAMLLLMIEKNIPFDEVIFIDTGVEHDEMYEHLSLIEKNTKIQITKLKSEKSFEYYLLSHKKSKGNTKNLLGYSFPNKRARWCTSCLKTSIIQKYLKEKYKNEKICQYIGLAFDEKGRINLEELKKGNVKYPLIDFNITEKDALEYCYKMGYTWNGLYQKFTRVSCWCCPLQTLNNLKSLYLYYPEKWKILDEWEQKTYRPFRMDYTIHGLEMLFNSEKK